MRWDDIVNITLMFAIWWIILSRWKFFYRARKYWLLFLCVYTITEAIGLFLALKGKNNLWIYEISRPAQFLLMLMYFRKAIPLDEHRFFNVLTTALIICTGLVHAKASSEYSSSEELVYSSIIILLCIKYFYTIIKAVDFIYLRQTEFWFVSALFIYFGTNLCINGSMNFLLKYQLDIARKLFYGMVVNTFIFYGMVIFALLSSYHIKRSPAHG
jgi:hypothetical protein